MDDRATVSRAHKARVELELVDEAFRGLRAAALEELVATTPEQSAKRERLIVCAQTIDAVRAALEGAITDGDVASYRLQLAEQDLLRR